jgi:hypothetical protein
MKNLKIQIVVTMTLGALSLMAGLFSHLALTDIYHGEADASLEWKIVQLSALIVLAFIGMALFTLTRTWRALA